MSNFRPFVLVGRESTEGLKLLSHSTMTAFSWASTSLVKFLLIVILLSELSASVQAFPLDLYHQPLHLTPTLSMPSHTRSHPCSLLTTSLTSYLFDTKGGHQHRLIIFTTIPQPNNLNINETQFLQESRKPKKFIKKSRGWCGGSRSAL